MTDILDLPTAVRYGQQLPSAVDGTQTLSRFQSSNGNTFKSNGANEIRINVSAPGFLIGDQGYLQFDLTNDSANDLALQGSAACIFNQLRIESNGVELERIENYGLLSYILDAAEGSTSSANMLTMAGGSSPVGSSWVGTGQTVATTATSSFTVKLKSGFLTNSLKKAIPLVGTGGITIILRLETNLAKSVKASANTISSITVSNPTYFAPVFQINDADFAQRYQAMLSQVGLEWTGVSYKHYQNALTATATTQVGQLNDRSRSLRGFVTAVRPDASVVTAATAQSFSCCIEDISKYEYDISGQTYPLSGVEYSQTKFGRAMEEMNKLLSVTGTTRVSMNNFISKHDDLAVGNGAVGRAGSDSCGLLCVDLKRYNDHGKLSMTGINTAASTTPSTVQITKDATGVTQTLNTYAVVDALYRLDSSGAFSVMM